MTINVINGVRFINKEELTKEVINIFFVFNIIVVLQWESFQNFEAFNFKFRDTEVNSKLKI